MTASLPAEVQDVFARFVTTELTTVDHRGQPVTWPVTPRYRPGGPFIEVSTPRYPSEARANPQVALLFSDPTGSGLERPPMVLVQGSADVDEPARPPRRALPRSNDPIHVRVRPERIYVWPRGELDSEPELFDAHMEEVRSGHSEEPDRFHAPPSGGVSLWDDRIAELGTAHPTAVLSVVCPDGFPFAVRVRVRLDPASRWVEIATTPDGLPLAPGRACLTAHRQDSSLAWMGELQVQGDLVPEGDRWALIPHRLLGGRQAPRSRFALARASTARARLAHLTAKREPARRS